MYLAAGILFGKVSLMSTMFPSFNILIQIIFWPSFVIAWAVEQATTGNLGYMLRYFWYKIKTKPSKCR